MTTPIIHPNWARPALNMVDGYSLEITAKDVDSLRAAAPGILPETPIALTFLPGEEFDARVAAARTARELGFEPMPHFSARRITSPDEFERYLAAVTREAGVKRSFVIAGDPAEPEGPFADSAALIATGEFERNGITAIGIGGHPEGHPNMSDEECWRVLQDKCAEVTARGMAPLIVTQFAFDADAVLAWLKELRERGIVAPVRLGVPGPAGIKTLMRFAARCGVGASASVMAKYGISITRLIGSAGPDKLVKALEQGLGEEHGPVRLHFYPFGGLEKTVAWINEFARKS
ncbi:methylenetetrahydrofolate reductase [Novosphingobium pentaromativorans]|uniref:Methylenetetrahydrofolate reductase n=1 Tax=Novosphingobium pentaromativorans US6-1 TaxID=1088721 RepID=G6EHE5_9SPHN|nr:methylenetetrahydrofolate reductase [Novosphingobium pentaromativorans]AIT81897.1 5,10-methylenetetrahydrofolate reductase [Novosphingobium pentaromativorans US6-1]EHJ59434.1 methylenetetrahydrofolate reductase (NADPH) [Novosphingobium pentaromativorans US6-1]